jgi:hypothetical protein
MRIVLKIWGRANEKSGEPEQVIKRSEQ